MMDIFFDTNDVPLHDIFLDAKKVCIKWWADILDCKVSFSRQRIDIPFDTMMNEYFPDNSYVTIIHRMFPSTEQVGEFGYRTMSIPSYFLWIITSVDDLYNIVNKYNIRKICWNQKQL